MLSTPLFCVYIYKCVYLSLSIFILTPFANLSLYLHFVAFSLGNWLKRSSLSGLTDGVEDLLDISSVDRLSFNRQGSKVCVFEFVFVRSLDC